MLPTEFLVRILDLLELWEAVSTWSELWPTLIIFIGKEGGGPRPVALIASLLRVWSRLRPSIARRREQDQRLAAFGEARDKSCERAGWEHNLMGYYAG